MTMTILKDIPLNKLVPSAANVRRTGREAGLDDLAASIAAHGLLQSLAVRPLLDEQGQDTGKFEVIGGGRRLAALKLLAKRKTVAKTAPVPCLIHAAGEAEELSLAENVMREALHPADQFEAFSRLHSGQGLGAEDIAARFGVTPAVVKQRLRLGAASSKLMGLYRDGIITLDQLMAFCLTDDPARQELAWEHLSFNKSPDMIRRMLTETHVSAKDRRAVFVGAEAYEAAGGIILRDLFTEDGGGYFADAVLLEQMTRAKLDALAVEVRAEGWKWTEAMPDFPYAHGLRRIYPQAVELSPDDQARLDALTVEAEALSAQYEGNDLPDDVAPRWNALSAEIDELSQRRYGFPAEEMARAGVFVSLGHDGQARIERGFVRPEDEIQPESEEPESEETENTETVSDDEEATEGDGEPAPAADDDEPDGLTPLSDRLQADLSAHRTMALRHSLGEHHDLALLAVVYTLALETFFHGYDRGSCLDLRANSPALGGHGDGIEDSPAARALATRHAQWAQRIPREAVHLWDWLTGLDAESRLALLAHCAALTVQAVRVPYDRRPRA
ncbi:MAG TPA: ParB/RepB/Spo0J family partition protein, partial [Patescibacteria group bacterium]|nr:ParB/RepB/Spo0J family partition protein [Patescibacteria group bacterium]